MRALPVPSALCVSGDDQLADGHSHCLHHHELAGHQRQHHVACGYRHCDRCHDRWCRRVDRELAQAHGAYTADVRKPLEGGGRFGGGGGAGAFLQLADHHCQLCSCLYPRGPRGADVFTLGLHQDLCHGSQCRAGGHLGSGADGLFHPRPRTS